MFLVRVIGLGPLAVGLLLAVPGVSGLLGALAARRLTGRVGTARALLLSALTALPFGLRQAYSPPAMRGRVTATMWVVLAGAQPFGALFGGRWARRSVSVARCGSCSAW